MTDFAVALSILRCVSWSIGNIQRNICPFFSVSLLTSASSAISVIQFSSTEHFKKKKREPQRGHSARMGQGVLACEVFYYYRVVVAVINVKKEEEEEENGTRGRGWMVFLRFYLRKGGWKASLFKITWTVSAQGFQVEKPTPGLNVQRLPGDLLGD